MKKLTDRWDRVYVQTPKSELSRVDGFIADDGELSSSVEVKVRWFKSGVLKRAFHNQVFLSTDKIRYGGLLAEVLFIPFSYVCILPNMDQVFIWEILNDEGKFLISYETGMEETQHDCGPGEETKVDEVAYLPVRKAKKFEVNINPDGR